ncbi:MAG: nucleotide exchange factor GrpE [Myxococcales bacterium]|nr:nucleotide exchange factor GrpE [Myxococcales bacterium]
MSTIEKRVDEIAAILRERGRQDAVQQKAFDTLYEELKQYKEDFMFQAEKPFLLDLLLFYDSLNWFHESLERREMSPDVVADSFQYLLDEFLELLYRRDVVPCESVDRFDRRLHKAVRIAPAATAADDWKVEAVLKRGFQRNDRILRAEEVSVYRVGADGGSGKD